MTPAQLGKAVQEILENTMTKVEGVKTKRYPIHNAVVEFNLNIQGYDEPQLLMDDEQGNMLSIRTGYKHGQFTEYVEPDRTELLEKWDRMVANTEETLSQAENVKDPEA
jgi:hypothetical protein